MVLVCKLKVSRTGLFGNVTVHWSVNASDSDVQTQSYLYPSSGSVSLVSGIYCHRFHINMIELE